MSNSDFVTAGSLIALPASTLRFPALRAATAFGSPRRCRRLSMRSRSTVGYNPGPVLMNHLIGKHNPRR
jgi:hypothetical protein